MTLAVDVAEDEATWRRRQRRQRYDWIALTPAVHCVASFHAVTVTDTTSEVTSKPVSTLTGELPLVSIK